jgi:gp16 family phage-associated protein
VQSESLFGPITKQACLAAKALLALAGDTPAKWAAREGFDPKTVYAVLSGNRRAIRGDSLQIAIKLGLRPDPSPVHLRPPSAIPTGRTLGKGAAVAPCDRGPFLQVGEPVR